MTSGRGRGADFTLQRYAMSTVGNLLDYGQLRELRPRTRLALEILHLLRAAHAAFGRAKRRNSELNRGVPVNEQFGRATHGGASFPRAAQSRIASGTGAIHRTSP